MVDADFGLDQLLDHLQGLPSRDRMAILSLLSPERRVQASALLHSSRKRRFQPAAGDHVSPLQRLSPQLSERITLAARTDDNPFTRATAQAILEAIKADEDSSAKQAVDNGNTESLVDQFKGFLAKIVPQS